MFRSTITLKMNRPDSIVLSAVIYDRIRQYHQWSLKEADKGNVDNYWHQRVVTLARMRNEMRRQRTQ